MFHINLYQVSQICLDFYFDRRGHVEFLSPSFMNQSCLQKYSLTCHITCQTSPLLLASIHKAAGALAQTYK